jgi:hypothetical protein
LFKVEEEKWLLPRVYTAADKPEVASTALPWGFLSTFFSARVTLFAPTTLAPASVKTTSSALASSGKKRAKVSIKMFLRNTVCSNYFLAV